jgi:hypothetical protein
MTTLSIDHYIETIEPHFNAVLWGDVMQRLELICEINGYDAQRAVSVLCLLVYPHMEDIDEDGMEDLALLDIALEEDSLCDAFSYVDPYGLRNYITSPTKND